MSQFSFPLITILALFVSATAGVFAQSDPEPFASAKTLYEAHKLDEARIAFAAIAAADPNNDKAQNFLGLIELQANNPAKATHYFARAVELVPDASEYHRRLGDAYGMHAMSASVFSKLGLAKKCRLAYEKAVETGPTNVGARWCLMEFYKQAPGFLGGSMDKAYEQAEAIRQLEPGPGRWAHALLLLKDEKATEALAPYTGALTAEPPDYAALYQLGRLAEWSGEQLDQGRQALEKCLTLEPRAWAGDHKEVHVALGHIHVKLKNLTAARASFQNALALDPEYKPAQEALAKLD